MTDLFLADALGHHTWATLRLLAACEPLSPEQLRTSVPGTYGSIVDTLRHLVESDASYLNVIGADRSPRMDDIAPGIAALTEAVRRLEAGWQWVRAAALDPAEELIRHRPDGSESHAPRSIRIAQAIQHAIDHRSQVCSALTTLDVEPPTLDVWQYGRELGRVWDVRPA